MFGEMKYYYQFIEGAIMGSVVADALGVPGEFMSRHELSKKPITDMIGGGAHNQLPGTWSDDTSMTLCTMDSLIACGIDFDDLMQRFSDWLRKASNTAREEVFDIGGTTRRAIVCYENHTPALDCGETSEYACGNGSLMRIIPTALYLVGQYGNRTLDDRSADIIHNTSKCTHAHLRCQMACGIFCSVVFQLCCGGDLRNATLFGIRSALAYYGKRPDFAVVYDEFSNLDTIQTWEESDVMSTGYVLHTLQAALWCLLNSSGYAECVLKAVNLGEDTDTTAAVAGALAGLWYGAKQIPEGWAQVTAKYEQIQERTKRFYYACLKNTETARSASAYTP